MAPPNPTSLAILLGVAILVSWRMYSRVRRLIGRQHLAPKRPWVTVILFPLLLLSLGIGAFRESATTFALLAGIGVGTALGLYGLQLTKFERTSEGLFYTPNAHIGIALSAVFVSRILYRLAQTLLFSATAPPTSAFASSPLTLAMVGMLAGYFVTYAIGLLRWSQRALREPPAPTPDTTA